MNEFYAINLDTLQICSMIGDALFLQARDTRSFYSEVDCVCRRASRKSGRKIVSVVVGVKYTNPNIFLFIIILTLLWVQMLSDPNEFY